MTPRIWDTFMFRDELDLLEMRLRHLDGVVWRHVLVEAMVTFQGGRKPLWFAEHRERFAAWADRIVHIRVPAAYLPGPGAWDRDHAQRECCLLGLADADRDDLILHGDVDELPDAAVVAALVPGEPAVFRMRYHPFAVDWLHQDHWSGTLAVPYRALGGLRQLRGERSALPPVAGGWHFSWLGGPAQIESKNRAYAHVEMGQAVDDANREGRLYEGGWYPWDGTSLAPVDVDESWPEYVWRRECPPSWFRPR